MGFFGRKHTEETRRRMSEAHKGKCGERSRGGSIADGYKLLIAAVVRQAIKDRAVWFFETEQGQVYCAVAGINPAKCQGGLV